VLGIEIIVDILGLAIKIDTALIEGILTKIPEESKIDLAKTIVLKTNLFKIDATNLIEEGRVYNSVDEVEDTSFKDVLS